MDIIMEAQKINYTPFIIGTEFASIFDFQELLDEYLTITGKEYEGGINDITMILLLRKHELIGQYFAIYYVKNKFLPYVNIIRYFPGQDISINYDKYKLSSISQMLSSNAELCELHTHIEDIVFSKIENALFIEDEFVSFLKKLRIIEV